MGNWGVTGVLPPQKHIISKETREKIRDLLNERNVAVEGLDGFLTEMEPSIGRFKTSELMHQASSPKNVSERLGKVKKLSDELRKSLERLDGKSSHLIYTRDQEVIGSCLHSLHRLSAVVDDSVKETCSHVRAGRKDESYREFFAADVRDGMKKFLNLTPSGSKEVQYGKSDLFTRLLEILLEEATGKEAKAVYGLVNKALKYELRREEGKIVIYTPSGWVD